MVVCGFWCVVVFFFFVCVVVVVFFWGDGLSCLFGFGFGFCLCCVVCVCGFFVFVFFFNRACIANLPGYGGTTYCYTITRHMPA